MNKKLTKYMIALAFFNLALSVWLHLGPFLGVIAAPGILMAAKEAWEGQNEG